jgi:hypothetical protein
MLSPSESHDEPPKTPPSIIVIILSAANRWLELGRAAYLRTKPESGVECARVKSKRHP